MELRAHFFIRSQFSIIVNQGTRYVYCVTILLARIIRWITRRYCMVLCVEKNDTTKIGKSRASLKIAWWYIFILTVLVAIIEGRKNKDSQYK